MGPSRTQLRRSSAQLHPSITRFWRTLYAALLVSCLVSAEPEGSSPVPVKVLDDDITAMTYDSARKALVLGGRRGSRYTQDAAGGWQREKVTGKLEQYPAITLENAPAVEFRSNEVHLYSGGGDFYIYCNILLQCVSVRRDTFEVAGGFWNLAAQGFMRMRFEATDAAEKFKTVSNIFPIGGTNDVFIAGFHSPRLPQKEDQESRGFIYYRTIANITSPTMANAYVRPITNKDAKRVRDDIHQDSLLNIISVNYYKRQMYQIVSVEQTHAKYPSFKVMVGRICDTVPTLVYPEMDLSCRGSRDAIASVKTSHRNDETLYVLFNGATQGTQKICEYSMNSLQGKLDALTKECMKGNATVIFESILGRCQAATADSTTCKFGYFTAFTNPNFVGEGKVVYDHNCSPEGCGTELAATHGTANPSENVVLFLGTATGGVVGLRLTSRGTEFESYTSWKVPGHVRQLIVDVNQETSNLDTPRYLFVRSGTLHRGVINSISLLDGCEREMPQAKCDSCLDYRVTPFCGWCMTSQSCSSKLHCPGTERSDVWLPTSCPAMKLSGNTDLIDVNSNRIVFELTHFDVSQVASLSCHFGDFGDTAITEEAGRFSCPLPRDGRLREPETRVPLKLQFTTRSGDNAVVAEVATTMYNCTAYDSCASCTNVNARRSFSCHWCLETAVCGNTCGDTGTVLQHSAVDKWLKKLMRFLASHLHENTYPGSPRHTRRHLEHRLFHHRH